MDDSFKSNESFQNHVKCLDKEAEKYCKEIYFGVNYAQVSERLEKNSSVCYFNITTLENENWCIELNNQGFLIVSNIFDSKDDIIRLNNISNQKKQFETIESLMFTISPLYSKRFNEMVSEKLKKNLTKILMSERD